jgi:hypothetical protein
MQQQPAVSWPPEHVPVQPPVEESRVKRPSDYALHVWTLVARRGMSPALAARRMSTSVWRVERIITGVARRNARRW